MLVELNVHTVLSRFALKVSLGFRKDDFESLSAQLAVRLEFDQHLVRVRVPRIVPRLLPLFALGKLDPGLHALCRHRQKFLLVRPAKSVRCTRFSIEDRRDSDRVIRAVQMMLQLKDLVKLEDDAIPRLGLDRPLYLFVFWVISVLDRAAIGVNGRLLLILLHPRSRHNIDRRSAMETSFPSFGGQSHGGQ